MRAGLFGLFIVLCGVSLLVGAQQVAWSQVFSLSSDAWLTLTASRLPRPSLCPRNCLRPAALTARPWPWARRRAPLPVRPPGPRRVR